jgi:uncharacterized RDD family membrane protein YckC
MLTTRGQSIGKRITGIRIVRHENDAPPGIVHAWVLRELLFWLMGCSSASSLHRSDPALPAFHITDGA